jgi:hypothetical protein
MGWVFRPRVVAHTFPAQYSLLFVPQKMHKHLFTDRLGAVWAFRDYRVTESGPEPVRLGDPAGEYRAFIGEGSGQLVVYKFGDLSYRTTAPNVLEAQLLFAKPAGVDAPLIRTMRPSGEFQVIRDDDDVPRADGVR